MNIFPLIVLLHDDGDEMKKMVMMAMTKIDMMTATMTKIDMMTATMTTVILPMMMTVRSEWRLPLRGQITYRHCRQPKLLHFLYFSICLFCGGAADAGNASTIFCFNVLTISKLTTLTVELSWTAPTENVKHHILGIHEAS